MIDEPPDNGDPPSVGRRRKIRVRRTLPAAELRCIISARRARGRSKVGRDQEELSDVPDAFQTGVAGSGVVLEPTNRA